MVHKIPEIFLKNSNIVPELFVYDFKMNANAVKDKVDLSMNMFSFLQTGQKQVHFANSVVGVNKKQSILIKSGNCLMTELLDDEVVYFCKLFFFSNKNIIDFLDKYNYLEVSSCSKEIIQSPFFTIENDDFIDSFVNSISSVLKFDDTAVIPLLVLKFEEIMLYLVHKYRTNFVCYLQSLVSQEANSSIRKIVEANVNSNLSLNEIAFLSHMSLSTFKRHFTKEYKVNPGKWLQQKRLNQAKIILEKGDKKPSEIFLDFGYTSLSNFSIAFKKEFGYSPKKCFKMD